MISFMRVIQSPDTQDHTGSTVTVTRRGPNVTLELDAVFSRLAISITLDAAVEVAEAIGEAVLFIPPEDKAGEGS